MTPITKREKKPIINAPKTVEEAEDALSKYATADAQAEEITAKMDQKITEIRNKHAEVLQLLGNTKEEEGKKVQMWAETNEDMFASKKSMDMAHGTVGFRTGQPKLKTLSGHTWASVTELMKERAPDYVKETLTPMKDKLIADRDNEEMDKFLKAIGLKIIQDETFFIELKKEESAPASV